VASAPVVAASVINANRRAQYARGWGEKGRQVRRRGRARAQGISDDVPAKELPALVGKARFPVVRPPKAYRFNPQRAECDVASRTAFGVPERDCLMSVDRLLEALDRVEPGAGDVWLADALWMSSNPQYIEARDALVAKALDPLVVDHVRKAALRSYVETVRAGGDPAAVVGVMLDDFAQMWMWRRRGISRSSVTAGCST
jgi:hypothetical protein